MSEEEVWVPVLGHEKTYEISNRGHLRSLTREVRYRHGTCIRPGREISGSADKDGYLIAGLSCWGVRRTVKLHRLVAESFLPPVPGAHHVNHKNFIKFDNRVENLEWVSHSTNMRHAAATGKLSGTFNPKKAKKLTAKDARAIRVELARGVAKSSVARMFGVCSGTITSIQRGKTWREA
jgi:hypothetical protein